MWEYDTYCNIFFGCGENETIIKYNVRARYAGVWFTFHWRLEQQKGFVMKIFIFFSAIYCTWCHNLYIDLTDLGTFCFCFFKIVEICPVDSVNSYYPPPSAHTLTHTHTLFSNIKTWKHVCVSHTLILRTHTSVCVRAPRWQMPSTHVNPTIKM